VSALDDWASVSATGNSQDPGHTCGIRQDGTLWCWGSNTHGELGLGDTTTRYRPYQVGTATWSQVDASFTKTCGLQINGTLWC
jgi:alpha-tubulin suppressor-like RCC1 family protein